MLASGLSCAAPSLRGLRLTSMPNGPHHKTGLRINTSQTAPPSVDGKGINIVQQRQSPLRVTKARGASPSAMSTTLPVRNAARKDTPKKRRTVKEMDPGRLERKRVNDRDAQSRARKDKAIAFNALNVLVTRENMMLRHISQRDPRLYQELISMEGLPPLPELPTKMNVGYEELPGLPRPQQAGSYRASQEASVEPDVSSNDSTGSAAHDIHAYDSSNELEAVTMIRRLSTNSSNVEQSFAMIGRTYSPLAASVEQDTTSAYPTAHGTHGQVNLPQQHQPFIGRPAIAPAHSSPLYPGGASPHVSATTEHRSHATHGANFFAANMRGRQNAEGYDMSNVPYFAQPQPSHPATTMSESMQYPNASGFSDDANFPGQFDLHTQGTFQGPEGLQGSVGFQHDRLYQGQVAPVHSPEMMGFQNQMGSQMSMLQPGAMVSQGSMPPQGGEAPMDHQRQGAYMG